tara:strand:- start:190 stop:420 length:231 start_codon:yes stop_codon:yes gene_type:complete
MDEHIQRINMSLGEGYTLSIVQPSGDRTVEVALYYQGDAVALKLPNSEYSQKYYAYVHADKLCELIDAAQQHINHS